MYSLLTEELNNYQKQSSLNEIYSKNMIGTTLKNNNKNLIMKSGSMESSNNECELIINKFNPTKNSPPSNWQFRLIKRINSLSEINTGD